MNTFFVQDFWQWRTFLSQKQSFYSVREKYRLDWWVSLLFVVSLTYFFSRNFLSFNSLGLQLFFVIFTVALVVFIGFFYKNKFFTYKFLPLVFLMIVNFFAIMFSFSFENTFILHFRFLFSPELIKKLENVSSSSFILNNQQLTPDQTLARTMIFTFLSSIIKIQLLFLLLFLNFERIKKAVVPLFQDHGLKIIFFLIAIIALNLINFPSNFSSKYLSSSFLEENISTNQSIINNINDGSSSFNKVYYGLGTVVLTPFWEEAIFRYSVFAIFGRRGVFWGIIFSFFFFTIVHYNPEDFRDNEKNLFIFFEKIFSSRLFFYIYGSLLLTFVFWFYDLNLLFPIFTHFMWNFNAMF